RECYGGAMTSRRPLRGSLALLVAALPACGPEAPPPVAPPAPAPEVSAPAPAPEPAARRPAYAPGGVWMPEQIPQHVETLKALGLEIEPAALSDPHSPVLGAVVSLGGCSASFVSEDGLVVTNHHCAVGALQLNSTPKDNILRDGFLAKTRAEERWAGP